MLGFKSFHELLGGSWGGEESWGGQEEMGGEGRGGEREGGRDET